MLFLVRQSPQVSFMSSTVISAFCHAVLSCAVSSRMLYPWFWYGALRFAVAKRQLFSTAHHSTTLLARSKVQNGLPYSLQLCWAPQLDSCCLCVPEGSLMAAWQESNSHERGHLVTLITKTLQDISEEEAQALPIKDPESAGLHDKLSSFLDRCTGCLKLRGDSTSMTQRQRSSTTVSDMSSQV